MPGGWALRPGGNGIERSFEIVHRLVVQPQTVVVAVAHHALLVDDDDGTLAACAVRLPDGLIDVSQQRNREAVLEDEALVGGQILRGDPDDRRIERRDVDRPSPAARSPAPARPPVVSWPRSDSMR